MAREHHPLTRVWPAALAATLLGGCVLPSPYRPEPPAPVVVPPGGPVAAPPSAAAEVPVQPSPPVHEFHLGAAARSLVTQARAQVARGDLPGASTTLDRALRIEPTNPLLWIELGRLRLAENDAHQAEGCGRKALALAGGDRRAQAQAGRVLADSLRAQRRNQEARDVENQPWMH
jgi:thioredoxin-like negative regulator of GroEL